MEHEDNPVVEYICPKCHHNFLYPLRKILSQEVLCHHCAKRDISGQLTLPTREFNLNDQTTLMLLTRLWHN